MQPGDSAILGEMRAPSMQLALAFASALLCSACPASQSGRAGAEAPRIQDLSPRELAQLAVPPTESSLLVYARLEELANQGSADAAWQRAHYLLDLFDAARFADDRGSRELLGKISDRPDEAMRGPGATQAIAELIAVEVDHVLEIDRAHSLANRAHALVSFDAVQAQARRESFQRSQELKRIVAQGGELAESASLRLFAYCKAALSDATQFAGPARRIAIAHCLYPLFSSDPEPYFATDPGRRPPPPSARVLLDQARTLLAHAKQSRLRTAFAAQEEWIETFSEAADALRPLDAIALHLPPASDVAPYDDVPLVAVAKSGAGPGSEGLAGALLADGRGTAGLALASESSAADLLAAASIAASAGASQLAILVRSEQRLRVPEGDYWSGRINGESITRVGSLPVSLALIESILVGQDDKDVKAAHWDPSRAALEMHLLVAPNAWRLVSPAGLVAAIDTSTSGTHDPQKELRMELQEIRRAFPDEDGLILVPLPGTSLGALVAAAVAARSNDQEQPLFSQLALRVKAPSIAKGDRLKKRISRRSLARVSVNPSTLESRIPIARRCYLALVDKSARTAGPVRLQLEQDGQVSVQGGKDLGLCATRAFVGQMQDEKISSVEVDFRVQAK